MTGGEVLSRRHAFTNHPLSISSWISVMRLVSSLTLPLYVTMPILPVIVMNGHRPTVST